MKSRFQHLIIACSLFVFGSVLGFAQQKNLVVVENEITKLDAEIFPNTTDNEINNIKNTISQTFNAFFTVKDIKRSIGKEILAIKIELMDQNGNTKNFSISGTKSIKPFKVYFYTNKTGQRNFGFEYIEIQNLTSNVKNTSVDTYVEKGAASKFFKTTIADEPNKYDEILTDPRIDAEKAYISINDTEATYEQLLQLENDTYDKSYIVYPGTSSDHRGLEKKYGAKSKYGIIFITTKEPIRIEIDKKDFSSNPSQSKLFDKYGAEGFIIHKKTSKADLEFYNKEFAYLNLKLSCTEIVKNKQREITGITISLTDTETNQTITNKWNSSQYPNGIPDIKVGKENDLLLLFVDKKK